MQDPIKAVRSAALEEQLRPNLGAIRSERLRALLARGWAPNPEARPTFEEVTRELAEISATTERKGRGGCALS